ncbi:MAG: cadherin domain-containing protein, partial [Thauera sp.]|nr:cadherin domain-containing protein [Thauera sp.]
MNRLNAGDTVTVSVEMSEAVQVTGSPTVVLVVGTTEVVAVYDAHTSTATRLEFSYTLLPGQTDVDGIAVKAGSLLGGSIVDAAGNPADRAFAAVGDNPAYTVDTRAPSIDSVALSGAGGVFSTGDRIALTVSFDEAVMVTGEPTLELRIGTKTVLARYVSGSGSADLVFEYEVEKGDLDSDGVAIVADSLGLDGGATIVDLAGNAVVATFAAVSDNLSYRVDAVAPVLESIDVVDEGDGVYSAGDKIRITLSEPVPDTLSLDVLSANNGQGFGTGASLAAVDASGGYAHVFELTLGANPTLVPGDALVLASDSLVDAAGNVQAAIQQATLPVVEDEIAPVVTKLELSSGTGAVNKIFNAGDTVTATVTFSEAVTVTGQPQLALSIGGTTVLADFADVSGRSIRFTYTIESGQVDLDGISIDADSLRLEGATIQDIAGNHAVPTHAAVAANGDFRVDTTAPVITAVAYGSNDGALALGEAVDLEITFSEAVSISGRVELTLTNGGTASYKSGAGTNKLVFGYSALEGQDASDLGVVALVGTVSDLAGNAADLSFASGYNPQGSLAVDTVSPEILGMVVDRAAQKIYLVFDEAPDPVQLQLPDPAQFDVFTMIDGSRAQNTVTAVSVDGQTVTLSLESAFQAGQVDVGYRDPNPLRNDTAALQDVAGNDARSFFSGQVVDGYVRDAKIFIDTGTDRNEDGVVDEKDYFDTGIRTNASGNFFLPADTPAGAIVAVGGVNIDTGIPNTVPLKAPAGATTINPLTTLVSAIVESGATPAEASSLVAKSLGLDPGLDLTSYDPYAVLKSGDPNDPAYQDALAAQKAAAQIVAIADLTSESQDASGAVFGNLAAVVATGGGEQRLDLTDSVVLRQTLPDLATRGDLLGQIGDAVSAIDAAPDIGAVAAAQTQFLDKTSPAKPVVFSPGVTADPTPSVRVEVETGRTDGSAVVVGDVVALLVDGVKVASTSITAEHIAQGYAELSVPSALREGSHTITAQLVDQAGNASLISAPASIQIDLTPPVVSVAAARINGAGEVEIVSNESGKIYLVREDVSIESVLDGTAEATAWKAIDVAAAYSPGSLAVAGLSDGGYLAYAVDAAGNIGAASANRVLIDNSPPAATASITRVDADPVTGPVAEGATTNDNTLLLGGSVAGSPDAGDLLVVYDNGVRLGEASIADGSWSFATPGLANGAHAFSVRFEDAAGNAGAPSAAYAVAVDTVIPDVGVAITSTATVTNDTTPEIRGTLDKPLQAGETLRVFDGNQFLGEALVTGTAWVFVPQTGLAAGAHVFSAAVESDAGTRGQASAPYKLAIDLTAPEVAIGGGVEGEVAKPLTVTFVFSEPVTGFTADDVAVQNGSVVNGTFKQVLGSAAGGTVYSVVITPSAGVEGTMTVGVAAGAALDLAGNGSLADALEQAIDTLAPQAPTIGVVAVDDTISASERSAGVVVAGTAEANASVRLTLGDNVVAVSADPQGKWSYAMSSADFVAMGQGPKTLSAVAIDALGNASAASTRTVTIDTVGPALSPFDLALDSQTGTSLFSNGITKDNTPTIRFTAEAGIGVEVFEAGVRLGAAVEDPNSAGSYTFTFGSGLSDGKHTIEIRATDEAGNTTQRTGTIAIDSTAPAVTSAESANAVENQSVLYKAIADDVGIVWTLGGADADALRIDSLGNVRLAAGVLDYESKPAYSFTVVATDAAGNASTARAVTVNVTNVDEQGPTFNSLATASVNENVAAGTVVYAAEAADTDFNAPATAGSVTYSLKAGGDAEAFAIDSATGAVTIEASPDFETKPSYSFTVVATDAVGNASERAVTLSVNNQDEAAPAFDSGSVAIVGDGTAAGTVVYTAEAIDPAFDGGPSAPLVYGIRGADAQSFAIDPTTGALTLVGAANYQAAPEYELELVVTDAAGNEAVQSLTVVVQAPGSSVNVAPIFASGSTARVAENTSPSTVLYTALAADPNSGDSITYTLKPGTGDGSAFAIDPASGAVRLLAAADFETKSSYTFTVVATDAGGLSAERDVTLTVSNVDELRPEFVSAASATVDENVAIGTVVYVASATDSDFNAPATASSVTYTLGGADAAAFAIDGRTGAVSIRTSPDYEVKPSYQFIVTATDAAGNQASRTVELSVNDLDEDSPTATIAVATPSLKAGQTSPVTITFSEPVFGFSNADLTVEGGSLSPMSSADGGRTWTGTLTPAPGYQGSNNVIRLGTSYSDSAGNVGTAATSNNYAIDTKIPTVAITTDDSALNLGDTATITLTFTEAPATLPAVTPSAGTLSALVRDSQNPLVYTATLTPPAATAAGSITFTVGAWADAAGNAGSASAAPTIAVDTVAPTITIHPVSGGYVNDAEDESAVTVSGTTTAEDGQVVTVTLG